MTRSPSPARQNPGPGWEPGGLACKGPSLCPAPRVTLFAVGMSEDEAAQAPRPSLWEQDQQVRGCTSHGAQHGRRGWAVPPGTVSDWVPLPLLRAPYSEGILERGWGRHIPPISQRGKVRLREGCVSGVCLSRHSQPAYLASAQLSPTPISGSLPVSLCFCVHHHGTLNNSNNNSNHGLYSASFTVPSASHIVLLESPSQP